LQPAALGALEEHDTDQIDQRPAKTADGGLGRDRPGRRRQQHLVADR